MKFIQEIYYAMKILQLVDSVLYGTKQDFVAELKNLVRKMLDPHEMMHFEGESPTGSLRN